jgi:hypothetical protein
MMKIKIKNFTYLVFLNLFLCNNILGNNDEKKESFVFQEHIKPYREYWASEAAVSLIPNIWNSKLLSDYVVKTKGAEKLNELKKKKSFPMEDKLALLKENAFIDAVVLPSLEEQYSNKDKEIESIKEINSKILDEAYKKNQEELNKLKMPEITVSEKFAQQKRKIEEIRSEINKLTTDKEAKKEAQIWKECSDAFNLDPSPENAEKLVLKYKEKYGSIESRYDLPNNILHDYKNSNPAATELIKKYAYIIQEIIAKDSSGINQTDISLLQENCKILQQKIADLETGVKKLSILNEKQVTHSTTESAITKEITTLKQTINNLEIHFKKQWYKFVTIAGSINVFLLLVVGYINYKKNHANED